MRSAERTEARPRVKINTNNVLYTNDDQRTTHAQPPPPTEMNNNIINNVLNAPYMPPSSSSVVMGTKKTRVQPGVLLSRRLFGWPRVAPRRCATPWPSSPPSPGYGYVSFGTNDGQGRLLTPTTQKAQKPPPSLVCMCFTPHQPMPEPVSPYEN